MIFTVVYIPESSTEFYFTAFSTDHFKTETLLLSFKVEQVLFVIFSHVVLQTGWFQCWHQRFLVIQCLIFKEKRAARGERQADILINYCSTSVISLNFGVAINKKLTAGLVERCFADCGCLLLCSLVCDSWSFC